MNKDMLELKHLAPYLPYKLRVMYGERNCVMNTGNGSSIYWIGINACLSRWWNEKYPIKPILRPLTDLVEEIEVNGEKFVPVMKIIEDAYNLTWDDDFQIIQDGRIIIDSMDEYTLALDDILKHVEFLFEWHFDVFGLIEKGLAINLNELSQMA